MRARSFTAKDMKAALEAVRGELGEEAVILSSHTADDGNLVVHAAIEDDEELASEETQEPASILESFDTRYRREVIARVRAPHKPRTVENTIPFDRDALFEILCAERTPDILAAELTDAAEESGFPDLAMALARALDQSMRNDPIVLTTAGAILLVGPHGSGKTNVAAKLAAEARLAGREVRLVATDTAGAGALSRLKELADPIGVEIVIAQDGEGLADSIAAAERQDIMMIADTASFDPRPKSAWREFLFLTRGCGEIVGVVSALTDAQEACEMARALKDFGASRLIVTGLDCTRRRGTVIALACSGLAIADVSHSPFVADGFAPLTPLALARDIVSRAQPYMPVPVTRAA